MEKYLYDWLIINGNNLIYRDDGSTVKIIDHLLIISMTGVFITEKQFSNKLVDENLKQDLSNQINDDSIIYKHHINSSSENSDYKEDGIYKFNCSLAIIIENNKNHCNKQQQQHKKSTITQLFKLVWGNLVIRNEIFKHLRFYNIHYGKTAILLRNEFIESPTSESMYHYRDYVDKVLLFDDTYIDKPTFTLIKANSIPSNVRYIQFNLKSLIEFEHGSLPQSLEFIYFHSISYSPFIQDIIPSNVTTISFASNFNGFQQSLGGGWLPKQLKVLLLHEDYHQPIDIGYLPESLIELRLPKNYRGTITPGSIPKSCKSLDYIFVSNSNKKILDRKKGIYIPKATTSLEFDQKFNQNILKDQIPGNVTKLKIPQCFSHEIEIGALPESLREFEYSFSFDPQIQPFLLPCNLTKLDLGSYSKPLIPNIFPISIKSLSFKSLKNGVPQGYFCNLINLKSLDLGLLNELPENSFPTSLKSLKLMYYGGPLSTKFLPCNLTHLTIERYNEPLTENMFPLSLLELNLPSYSIDIIPNSLPKNLKKLCVSSFDRDHLFNLDCLPPSLETIEITVFKQKLINSMDPQLFKYVKWVDSQ